MISYIIPVYNGEKYIEKCIKSIIETNVASSNYEIIVINDGSIDNTSVIVHEISLSNKMVHLVEKMNTGVSDTRNQGIGIANGEWIVFVDADDCITENLCTLLPITDEYDWCVFSCKASKDFQVDANNEKEVFEVKKAILNQSEMLNSIHFNTVWSKGYKRDILLKNDVRFDSSINHGEDMLFNLDYIKHCKNILVKSKSIYNLWQNMDSATHRYQEKAPINDKAFANALIERINCHTPEMDKLFFRIVQNGIIITLRSYFAHRENKKRYLVRRAEFIRFIKESPYKEALTNNYSRDVKKRLIVSLIQARMYAIVFAYFRISTAKKKVSIEKYTRI